MMPRQQLLDAKRGWSVPQGLRHSRPREIRLTAAGKALAVLSIACVLAALVTSVVLFALALRQQSERRGLIEHGVKTTAAVTRLWTTRDRDDDDDMQRWVAFEFAVDERQIQGQQRIGRATASRLFEGARIPIRYDPASPSTFVTFNRSVQPVGFWLASLGWLALTTGGALIALPLLWQRRLLAEGRPAPGVVVKRKRTRTQHGSHDHVEYEFLLLNGAAHAGKAAARKLQEGQAVCVLYEPDNPKRSAVYPLTLVRPV